MNENNVSYDNLINIKFEFHKGLFNEIIYLFMATIKKFVLYVLI